MSISYSEYLHRLHNADSRSGNRLDADAIAHLDQLTGLISQIDREGDVVEYAAQRQSEQFKILQRVIDGLASHLENDELLAEAIEQVSVLVGSREVWIVESTPARGIGAVHLLGEVVVGGSDLPDEVADICKSINLEFPTPNSKAKICRDGRELWAIPIPVRGHIFGVLVYSLSDRSPVNAVVRKRMIQSILRYVGVAVENRHLIESLQEMVAEVVCGFSLAIDSRDSYTGGHVQRVTAYAVHLAVAAGLSEEDQAIVRLGGLLHDIGKVAIPDDILNKPSRLTDDEFAVIKAHAAVGHEILRRIPHLERANEIVRHHHERWDGRGYPDGLAGNDIPLLARILAIADSFDAMTSNRSYRNTLEHHVAMEEIERCAGSQFDPDLAKLFCEFSSAELKTAAERMHRWIQCTDHSQGLNFDRLISWNKPLYQA